MFYPINTWKSNGQLVKFACGESTLSEAVFAGENATFYGDQLFLTVMEFDTYKNILIILMRRFKC